MLQKTNKTPLEFPQSKMDELYYIFQEDDLIKEYQHKMCINSVFGRPNALSVLQTNYPTIGPGNPNQGDCTWGPFELTDGQLVDKILHEQIKPKGLVKNTKNMAKIANILIVMNELKLRGKVYYKTVKGKTYVILKGNPGQRNTLKGTRYLNTNPQIVELGLAKVDVKKVFAKGFKTSFLVYGALKAVEGVDLILKDGALKPSYFTEIGTALPKMGLASLLTAAAAGVVATTSLPFVAGAGIVLVAGFAAGIGLEFLDRKFEITKKLNEAADKMWENLMANPNISASNPGNPKDPCNLLKGLPCGIPYAYKKMIQKDQQIIYTA